MSDDDLRARVAQVLRQNDERNMNYGHYEWDDLTDVAQQMYLVDADAVLAALPRYEQVGWRSPSGYVSLPSGIEPDWRGIPGGRAHLPPPPDRRSAAQ